MPLRQIAVFGIALLVLTGCFRQSGDDFQAVDSQSAGNGQAAPATATLEESEEATSEALPPEATEDSPPVTLLAPPSETATEPAPLLDPTDVPLVVPSSTPTVAPQQVIASPTVSTQVEQPTNIPTATAITFITPGAPVQVEQPTATPLPTETSDAEAAEDEADDTNTSGIRTPTALPEGIDAACTYTVRAGDNLFRIALRNNTSVEALQSANSLNGEVIQPGQVLEIPNCIPDDSETSEAAPEGGDVTDSGIVHRVQSGETLGGIARRYGTTIDAILELNPQITNPDRLSLNQEIAIPE